MFVARAPSRVVLCASRSYATGDAIQRMREQFQAMRTGQPVQERKPQQGIPGVKHIVAVSSAKGGVGKSTCSVNIAVGLSTLGLRVGLMDGDIYGPSVPTMMNLKDKRCSLVYDPEREAELVEPLVNYNVKCVSIGFMVPNSSSVVWRGAMAVRAITQMIQQVKWNDPDLDVLIVDFAPGTGDTQLSMAQMIPFSGAVVVTTPQDVALQDVVRGLDMFAKVHVPILGIVENMSYYKCPACGNVDDVFGHGGGRDLATTHNAPFLGAIPLHVTVRKHSDAGTPIVLAEPKSPYAQAFLSIAEKVKEKLETVGSSVPKIEIE